MFLLFSSLVVDRFLGSKAPKYPPDMHWRYLPSATSHYIRWHEIDQYFGTRIAQIVDLFAARRNFVSYSALAQTVSASRFRPPQLQSPDSLFATDENTNEQHFAATSSHHRYRLSDTKALSRTGETSNTPRAVPIQLRFRRRGETTANLLETNGEKPTKRFATNFATSQVDDEQFRRFRRKLFATNEDKQRRHEVADIYSL
jgi:hypothetical protein